MIVFGFVWTFLAAMGAILVVGYTGTFPVFVLLQSGLLPVWFFWQWFRWKAGKRVAETR
jgi:hypothetical protein